MSSPSPGTVLTGDFWPEPVRVLTVQSVGDRVKIEAVGVKTQQYYSRILVQSDLERILTKSATARDFGGSAEAVFLAIEAQRIHYAYQFDPLLAINVSQVEPLPHQIEAVYHAILQQGRVRFLLADDPGAGKTIMTGLLLKELKYRGLIHRILIVVPGHLKDQWLRELKEKFGETFVAADRGLLAATWGRNVWAEEPQVITSMDFCKQDEVMASLAEAKTWDLVVVDGAHKMAAYRYGEKTKKTDRYRLGELLSRTSQYLLFLTATPHRGDPENFRLLLDLLEPGLFASTELIAESVALRENPLFLRRLKEDLKDFEGKPLFPPRHVVTKPYHLNDDEKRLYNAVTQYVEHSYNQALATEKRNVAFALLILQRRLASSVRAVRRSLERRKSRLEELLTVGQWLAERETIDEEVLEDAPEAERLRQEEELLERLTAAETRQELQEEIKTLEELIHLAREAERNEVETKLTEAYLGGSIAPEVFKELGATLREEEQNLKRAVAKLEMELIERERSAEYRKLLQRVVDDFEAVEQRLDIAKKKELLRLIFKRVLIDGRKIVGFEMYEPFQRMYNEVLTELNEKKDKELTSECSDECILAPTAARWPRYYTRLVGLMRGFTESLAGFPTR